MGSCCATDCLTPVAPGHVMCGEHWAAVPLEQKKEIYHQRARQAQGWPDAKDLLQAAIDAATESVQ